MTFAIVGLSGALAVAAAVALFFVIVVGFATYEIRKPLTAQERRVAREQARRRGASTPPPIDGSAIRVIGDGRRDPGPDIDQPLGKERIGR